MRIDRKISRYIAFGIVIGVILIAVIVSSNQEKIVNLPSVELLKNPDGSFDASVVFGEFRKSEVKGGKKQWEVYARVGRYRPQDGKAELDHPIVSLYKDDDVIELTADKGIVTLEGTGLKNVDAVGNVIITSVNKETTVKANQMMFDQSTEVITAPGMVYIDSPQIKTSGMDLQGNTALNKFTLQKQVETIVEPKEK